MRIVHVQEWFIPGMGYQENCLPWEQRKSGHEVFMISSDRYPGYHGYAAYVEQRFKKRILGPSVESHQGVEIHRIPCVFEKKEGSILYLARLKERLSQLSPDVVHLHGALTLTTLRAIRIAKHSGLRVYVDDHSHATNLNLRNIPRKAYVRSARFIHKRYGTCVRRYLPVTPAAKDILVSLLGVEPERIELLPLGIDDLLFRPSEDLRRKGRKSIGVTDDEILIITSGKLHSEKRADDLIEAFGTVVAEFGDSKLLILGNGTREYMSHLRSLVLKLNLSEHVIFNDIAPRELLPQYYNAADIGVWPGSPSITALEALGCGLPIVVPERDSAYEVVLSKGAAIGFRDEGTRLLGQFLCQLIRDYDERRQVVRNIRRLIEGELSWKRIAARSIEIYGRG